MPQPINLAFVRARAGQADELGRCLHALARRSHREAARHRFDIRRSAKDPHLWLVAEIWSLSAAPADRSHLRAFISDAPMLIDVSIPFEVSMST